MVCYMCLQECENDDNIKIFDTHGIELRINEIIKQHFWLEPTNEDPELNVCNSCWLKISNFHEYYCTVERAHKRLLEEVPYLINSIKHEEIGTTSMWNKENSMDGIGFTVHDTDAKEKCTKELLFQEDRSSDTLANQEESNCSENKVKIEDDEGTLIEKDEDKVTTRTRRKAQIRRKTSTVFENDNFSSLDDEDQNDEETLIKKKRKKDEMNIKRLEEDKLILKHIKLKCDICVMEFSKFSEVQTHFHKIHKRKGYVICCNRRLHYKKNVLEHIDRHLHPENFTCEKCNKEYSDKNGLKLHMISQHGLHEETTFKCNFCPRKFAKMSLLNRHKDVHVPENKRNLPCDICEKKFASEAALKKHVQYVHENAYTRICHICGKLIRGRVFFKTHVLEHSGISAPKVKCEQCGIWLKDIYILKRHIKRAHEEGPITCPTCGVILSSIVCLRSHIRDVHTAERRFECNICHKAYKRRHKLKDHMATHTGETFNCNYCPQTFISRGGMEHHRKTVHKELWEEEKRKRYLPTTQEILTIPTRKE